MSRTATVREFVKNNFSVNLKTLFPIVQWLPGYRFSTLRSDAIAGLSVSLLIIPHAFAHAIIAGLHPQIGLYTSFPTMFVYALLGTCKDMNMGTTLITALLTNRFSITEETNPEIAASLAFLVGIILVTIAICRLSFVGRLLSLPVTSGFTSASGIIFIIVQTSFLLGLKRPPRPIYLKVKHVFQNIKYTRPSDAVLGLVSLTTLFLLQKMASQKRQENPSLCRKVTRNVVTVLAIGRNAIIPLLGIVVAYLCYVITNENLFTTVGNIPAGLPKLKMPLRPIKIVENRTMEIKELVRGFGSGLGITPLIIMVQAIAISKSLGRKSKQRIDTFQELLATGFANVFVSFFSGFPVTASFSRSAVNNMSGAKTCFSGVIASLAVLIAIEFCGPVFRYIPYTVLAAISIAAAVNMIDYKLPKKLWHVNKPDLVVWLVLFCGNLYEFEIGIFSSVLISLAIVLYREFNPRLDVNFDKEAKSVTVSLKGGVWFPGIEAVADKIRLELEKRGSDNVSVVVVDCKHMLEVDYTVVHGINEIIADCLLSNVEVRFDNVQDKKVRKHFRDAGFFKPTTSMLGNDDDDDSEENVNGELIGNGSNELGLEPIVSEKKGSPTARTSKDQSEMEHLVAID
eukprot:gene14989-16535_t